ncbi:MAG: GAF domain-containing protein [Nitrospirae bacterium]|nr:GAF domain-containing protein [Nitrospirota bacterium]
MEREEGIRKRVEEFLQVFRKGEEFTQDLLKENERLRFKIAQLEETLRKSEDETRMKLYIERINALETENKNLLEKYKLVEEENKDFAAKYVEVEEENNNLANLYVASYQLHSTLDFNEVLRIVLEIIINLIGAEKFALMLMDDKSNQLLPAASEGINLDIIPSVKMGNGVIGTVARSGESYFGSDLSAGQTDDFSKPLVCIPLKIKEHVIGVVVIYSLLVQKKGFSNIDYELFNLLAGHAATAIFSSKLYTQSERKLTTIQSFLELLKEKPKK